MHYRVFDVYMWSFCMNVYTWGTWVYSLIKRTFIEPAQNFVSGELLVHTHGELLGHTHSLACNGDCHSSLWWSQSAVHKLAFMAPPSLISQLCGVKQLTLEPLVKSLSVVFVWCTDLNHILSVVFVWCTDLNHNTEKLFISYNVVLCS